MNAPYPPGIVRFALFGVVYMVSGLVWERRASEMRIKKEEVGALYSDEIV